MHFRKRFGISFGWQARGTLLAILAIRGLAQPQPATKEMDGHHQTTGMSDMPGMDHGTQMNEAGMYLMNVASGTSVNSPGGAIFIAVVAINFIGDGLRDALDARRVI